MVGYTEFVNKQTGTRMWVAEDRKDEYIAAGHKPAAASADKPTAEKPEAKKRTTRKKA